jgi:transcriptional regulator with XRE-family HTH domain
MTNKSIGTFLAELRKEKGLTQKDVADFLNVSDKTVSHWECDKYSPDITAIPILAEFFGVTCDEILKGEKAVPLYNETVAEATDEEASCDENNNEINFSYEPLIKDNEYNKYTRIRLHNAFSKRKLINVVAIFVAIVLWGVSWTVIQLIEHKIAIYNFELYAAIGSAFVSVAVGAIIILSSHLKFMSMVNMCPFEEVEFLKWRRMARSINIVPMAIFVLLCIIACIMFSPLDDAELVTGTEVFTGYAEENEDFPVSVDASENYTDGDLIMPVPTSMTSDDGETQYADTSEQANILTD